MNKKIEQKIKKCLESNSYNKIYCLSNIEYFESKDELDPLTNVLIIE